MYTQLIFTATLKADTPIEVINTIRIMLDEIEESDIIRPVFETSTGRNPLRGSGGPFSNPISYFKFKNNLWTLKNRANIKNYENEINQFLDWILPYIESCPNNIYATIRYEEDEGSTPLYLKNN